MYEEEAAEEGASPSHRLVNALVPLWDLANHTPEPPTLSTDYDDEKDMLVCMANKDFRADQEFTIFYGKRGNQELLVHNGFALEDNQHDSLPIKLGVGAKDTAAIKRTKLLSALNLSPKGSFDLSRSSLDKVSYSINVYLMRFISKHLVLFSGTNR